MVSLLSLAFLSLSTESGSKVWNLLNTLQKQQTHKSMQTCFQKFDYAMDGLINNILGSM